MAGKAPLLLAMVLFLVGAAGLGLSSAERASWGPFQPPHRSLTEQPILVHQDGLALLEPPSLFELTQPEETAILSEEPQLVATAAEPAPRYVAEEPAATPVTPPLRIFGISADDGGVSAASASPEPPPPILVGGIAYDDGVVSDTPVGPTDETEPVTDPESLYEEPVAGADVATPNPVAPAETPTAD